VTLAQAVLGGTVKVPTLSGAEVEIKVPPGTQPEEKRVLRNQGVSAVGQPGTKGHHYIHFKVEIPTYVVPPFFFTARSLALGRSLTRLCPFYHHPNNSKLTPKQKELMEEWQKEEEEQSGGIADKLKGYFKS
jgi:DnaJ-class molecular chaperone